MLKTKKLVKSRKVMTSGGDRLDEPIDSPTSLMTMFQSILLDYSSLSEFVSNLSKKGRMMFASPCL